MHRKRSQKLKSSQLCCFDSTGTSATLLGRRRHYWDVGNTTGTSATLLGRRGHNEKSVPIYRKRHSSIADEMAGTCPRHLQRYGNQALECAFSRPFSVYSGLLLERNQRRKATYLLINYLRNF